MDAAVITKNMVDETKETPVVRTVRVRSHAHLRKLRIDFTRDEIQNVIAGVKHYGSRWTDILAMYKFHASRTAVDLKEKWTRMKRTSASTRN